MAATQTEITTLQSIAGRVAGLNVEVERLHDAAYPPLKLAHAWPAFIAAANRPDSGPATLAQYKFQWSAFEKWMADQNPDTTFLCDVTEDCGIAYATHLNGCVGPSTFNRHIGLLRRVFRVLSKSAKITTNPFAEVATKRAIPNSRRELTIEELQRVCTAAEGELKLVLAIGIYSGLRLGDAATLRWDEVDLVRGEIRRIPNKTARHNPKPVHIPLHISLATLLAEIPARKRRGFVLPAMAEKYQGKRDQVTDMIQRHFFNCGIACHAPGTGWQIVMEEDGQPRMTDSGNVLLAKTNKPAVLQVGFHSLRHSFVSLCRAADVPLSVVEAIVGHSSPAMTRHYTHTGESAARLAVDSLPSLGIDKPLAALPAPVQSDCAVDLLAKVKAVLRAPGAANERIGKALALLEAEKVE